MLCYAMKYSIYFPNFVPQLLARSARRIALRLFGVGFSSTSTTREILYSPKKAMTLLQTSFSGEIMDEDIQLAVFLFA